MALVAFHFKKISAEKKKASATKVNAKNNIQITNVKEAKLNMGSAKQSGVEFEFSFDVSYEPDLGNINLVGAVVYMGTNDTVKEILETWTKEKQVAKVVIEELYNHLLHRCNIQALIMSRDMALPSHIQMPRVKSK
jgi:hypothetical protein